MNGSITHQRLSSDSTRMMFHCLREYWKSRRRWRLDRKRFETLRCETWTATTADGGSTTGRSWWTASCSPVRRSIPSGSDSEDSDRSSRALVSMSHCTISRPSCGGTSRAASSRRASDWRCRCLSSKEDWVRSQNPKEKLRVRWWSGLRVDHRDWIIRKVEKQKRDSNQLDPFRFEMWCLTMADLISGKIQSQLVRSWFRNHQFSYAFIYCTSYFMVDVNENYFSSV